MPFTIKCSQRGCTSKSTAAKAPKLCPVCQNPLQPGDARGKATAPAPAPASPGAGGEGGAS